MAQVLATPGVYIEEKSAFPSSAVQVATAVPAFVGYTEKALKNNKSIVNKPTRITSLSEYHQFLEVLRRRLSQLLQMMLQVFHWP